MFKHWRISLLVSLIFFSVITYSCRTKSKLDLIVFVAPECPISEAILLNLKNISTEFAEEQLKIQLVVPGNLYSKSEVDSFIKVNNINFEVLIDSNAVFVKKYNASITPEVFLVSNGKLIYTGAVDDRAIDNEIIKQSAAENYLYDAIKNTLEGKEVSVKKTKAIGCYIEL